MIYPRKRVLKPGPDNYRTTTALPEHAPEPSPGFLAFAASCRELLLRYGTDATGTLRHRTKPVHHIEGRDARRHPVQHYGDMRECAAMVEAWMSTSQSGPWPMYRRLE